MPKFRTHNVDLASACLIAWQTRKAITFTYVDESGTDVMAHGFIISMTEVREGSERSWDVTYLAEV